MLNSIVSRFLDPFLSQYFKVNSKQIEVELRNGKAQLKDLIFQEDCFIQHQIPFYVKRGLVNSLSVTISSEQCNIFIENLVLLGSEVYGSTIITENQIIETFSGKTFIKQIIKSIISLFFDSSFESMKKLFDNLTISIQKIHIRIEGLMNSQSLGIMFGSINFYSVNEEMQKIIVKNHPTTFSKKIEVKNFSIYFDTENKYPINKYSDSFESQMIMQIANENEFILNPNSFDCVFTYNSELNSITEFKSNLTELKLSFNNLQYEAFKNLVNNIKKQRSLNFLGRPFKSVKSERSSTLWWCYSYRCIRYKKTNYQALDISLAIDVLKNRKKFYSLWKDFVLNPYRYKSTFNEFKNTLKPNTVALLRQYSSFIFSKDANNHSKLFTEEDIIRYFAKPKEIIPSECQIKLDSFQFDLNLKIKIEKNENSNNNIINRNEAVIEEEEEDGGNGYEEKFEYNLIPLLCFSFDDFTLNGSRTNESNKIEFETSSFNISNYTSEKYRKTLQLQEGIKGLIDISSNDLNQTVKLDVTSISGIFDVNLMATYFEYFTKGSDFRQTFDIVGLIEKDVKDIIKKHPRIKLDLKIGNSILIIPYQEIENDSPVFQISIDSLEIHSYLSKYNINIIESLYDKYELMLNSIQLSLNDKIFSNKFDMKSNVNLAIIPFKETESLIINNTLSPVEIHITVFESLLLYQIFLYLSDELRISDETKQLINTFIPEFKIDFLIPSITIFFLYRDTSVYSNTEAFKITLKDETKINVLINRECLDLSILNNSGVDAIEFFNSDNGKFLYTNKYEFILKACKSSKKIVLDFGDFELYAKAIPLNFIQVFAESPTHFEWKLHLKEESTIEKYLHKPKIKEEGNNDMNFDIKLKQTKIHFIDHEVDNNGNSKEDEIMFTVTTNYVIFYIKQDKDNIDVRLESDPPQATTSQYGTIWTNIISKEELPSSPIIIHLTPSSVAFDLDYFQINIPPMILSKVTKFALLEKNPYSHLFGDPGTVKFLTFNLSAKTFIIKIVYDTESLSYYELNISQFRMETLKAPYLHQILLDRIQIIRKLQNKNDDLLFKLENLDMNLNMKLLLRDNCDISKVDTFENLVKEKGIEKWTEETLNFLEENSKSNKKIFWSSFFYFYELDFSFNFDYLFCIYSHEFARNMSYLTFRVLDIMKNDSFFNINKSLEKPDEPLDICCDVKMSKGEFLIFDQLENKIARLLINNASAQAKPNKFVYNIELDSINLVNYNEEKIMETGHLSIQTENEKILANLDSFDLTMKLKYVPDSVYYIMNCPLFSFVDEFNSESKPTSLEMTKEIYVSLNKFRVTVPIKDTIFLFETAFDASLTPQGNIVQIKDIQFTMNDKIIMKKFSISFANDLWNVEPITITFSVFEFHVIQMLVDEIKGLKMPPIYLSKVDTEFKRRKYAVQLQQIDLILTQPNLPFITLEIKPSTFKQGYNDENGGEKLIEYNVEMLLKHENHSNYGIDTIIDPFILSVNSKIINNKRYMNADISPINIAISPYIMAEVLQFKKKYSLYKSTEQIFQERIIFFQNDTGIAVRLFLKNDSGQVEENEINNDAPFQMNNYNWTYDIKVMYLDKTVIFSIKDLCFPIFYDQTVVVYLVADVGIQTIHFSSPYMIKNELPYNIDVLINDEFIGVVKSKSEKAVPLTLISSVLNGIKAGISPASSPLSPAVKFKKPNLESKLYKFIDSQNKRNYYSSVSLLTDPQRSICYIKFEPHVTYTNQLPIPVSLTLLNNYNINYHLETGQSIDVSFLKDKKIRLKIKIAVEPFGESDPTEVYTFSNSNLSKISIKRNKEEKCKIVVMSDFSKKKNIYQVYIFAPCILYNRTGALLSLKDTKDVYYSFIDNICFYTPEEYPKKVPLRIMMRDVTYLNKIEINCVNAKSTQMFPLPFINNENIFFLLSANKVITPFENTTHLELMVHFMVFNHLDKSAFLIPSNANDSKQFINHCQPNKKVPIVFANLEGKFTFYMDGFRECLELNLLNQTTTVFRLLSKKSNVSDFLIQLDVIKEENGYCGHLSYPTFPSPTVISNMISNQLISIDQTKSFNEKNPMFISSMSTSLFAKPQPFIEHDENSVVIGVRDIEIIIDFSSDVPPQPIPNSNYFFVVQTTDTGDKMIVIGDQDSYNFIVNNKPLTNPKETPLLNVCLSKIEISFIDNYMHELFLIAIKNIIFKLKRSKSIKFTIDSFHVNDMCIASKSPVVICEEEGRFLTFKLKSEFPLRMHSFESIDINISPIHIFVDVKFILDICFALNGFLENFKFEFEMNQKIKEVDEVKLKRFSFYSLQHLFISPLRLDLTLVKSKGRQNRVPIPQNKNFILTSLLKNIFIIPLETHKEFNSIAIHNIRAPIHNFINSLAILYLNQISHADIYNLLFRDASLFNLSMTENFQDFIDDSISSGDSSCASSSATASPSKASRVIAKPERIPRSFPLNRIISVSSDYYRYSLAQFVFQKTHPYETLLALIESKNLDNKVLVLFNHYIVILSENLQNVKFEIKITDLASIINQGSLLTLEIKNNQRINFICDDYYESRLMVTMVKSISDRMTLFCE